MQAAVEIPRFDLPCYERFVRHLWAYRDDAGESAVSGPPTVFTIYYDDEGEAQVLREIYDALVAVEPAWVDRVRGSGYLAFGDLQVLYAYLRCLCRAARSGDVRAQRLGEYVMWVLGFRWVSGEGDGSGHVG